MLTRKGYYIANDIEKLYLDFIEYILGVKYEKFIQLPPIIFQIPYTVVVFFDSPNIPSSIKSKWNFSISLAF